MCTVNHIARVFQLLFWFITPSVILTGGLLPSDHLPASGGWNPGLGTDIPTNYTIFCNVKVSIPGTSVVAIGDGITDDTAALQAAVMLATNKSIVYIPEGIYRTSGEIALRCKYNYDNVAYPRSVVIRGAGMAKTRIINYGNSVSIIGFYGNGAVVGLSVVAGFERGSTNLILNTAVPSYMKPGNWISLSADNDSTGAEFIPAYMNSCVGQSVKIVSTSGSSIQIDRPVNFTSTNTKVSMSFSIPYRCGIENLTVERANKMGQHNIFLGNVAECWVINVEGIRPLGWNIRLDGSVGCVVRQCFVHDTWNGGGNSGYGVGLFNRCGECLVEDNIAVRCRHSYITEYGGQGNVFAYNYSFNPINENQTNTDFLMIDACHHGGDPRYNLWEGNVVAKMGPDNVLGASHCNTYFRNNPQSKGLPATGYGRWAFNVERNSLSNSFIGNVLLTPEQIADGVTFTNSIQNKVLRRFGYANSGDTNHTDVDMRVFATTIYHMNWDYTFQTNALDPRIPSTNLPSSLYLTEKPAFFGDLRWPPIGPDIIPHASPIPAQVRCLTMLTDIHAASPTLAAISGWSNYPGLIPPDRLPASGGWQPGPSSGIPTNYTLFCNVKESIPGTNIVALGDGITDDTAALQAAVASAPNFSIVFIPEGIYRTTHEIMLQCKYNYDYQAHSRSIIIRGAGMGKTRIINFGSDASIIGFYAQGAVTELPIRGGILRGTNQINIDALNVSYIKPGKWLSISADNSLTGTESVAGYMTDCVGQSVKILSVSGSTITLDRPLNFSSPLAKASYSFSVPYQCGIESLTVERAVNSGQHNIYLCGAQECWITNVEGIKPVNWNIRFDSGVGCVVRQCYVHGTWNGGGNSGYGIGLFNRSGECLVEDNIAFNCRHSYITEYGGQGNVFAYNYSSDPLNEKQTNTDFLMIDACHHGGDPRYNLWEGNVVAKMGPDNVLGGSHCNTYFRNNAQRKGMPSAKYGLWAVNVERNCISNNFIGNVLLSSGLSAITQFCTNSAQNNVLCRFGYDGSGDTNHADIDMRVFESTIYHMNWDFAFQTTVMDTRILQHTLPASLYYAQKPAFFGSLRWPPIGPDLAPTTTLIPAQVRWNKMTNSAYIAPPSNAKIQSSQ